MTRAFPSIDFERLFKLRLVVARHGEMDGARWWNTQGMLGRRGAAVLKRGFPSTYRFAQARIVFEVARTRCIELFDPPGCMTLWHLPAEVEDQFEEHWLGWLDNRDQWGAVFETIEGQTGQDLLTSLKALDLISQPEIQVVSKLRRSAENRAVPVPGSHQPSDEVLTLLAAGFSRGEAGAPAIPYTRLDT